MSATQIPPASTPVSGTVAATQSGTWTVQPGNTANTTAWKVDGSAVTQPVSGTVTAAQATAASLNAQVVGDVASGSSDGGNPVKTGGKAASAAPTSVTAGQRVNGLFDLWGRQHVRTGDQAPVASTFTQVHVPATAAQATKTQASAGGTKRNVCTGFTVTYCGGSTAPAAAVPLTVAVIDGATGVATYLWRSNITVPAVAGAQVSIVRTGMWLVGSQATALTVEFSAAGGTNTFQSVAFDGVIIDE